MGRSYIISYLCPNAAPEGDGVKRLDQLDPDQRCTFWLSGRIADAFSVSNMIHSREGLHNAIVSESKSEKQPEVAGQESGDC